MNTATIETAAPKRIRTTAEIALEAKIHSVNHLRLIEILSEGPATMTAVAAKIGFSTAAMTGAVDSLENAGYVERVRLQHDRRIYHVRLTGNGAALAAKLNPQPAAV